MKNLIFIFLPIFFFLSCSSIKTEKKEDDHKKLNNFSNASKEFKINDLFLKASHASIRGNVSVSVPMWEEILSLGETDQYITKKYAVDLIRSGQVDKAKKVLEDFYNGHRIPDENVGLVLAGFYLSSGEKEKARKIYLQIEKKMTGPEPCILLAKTYVDEKNFIKADDILVKCEKRFKNNPQILSFRAGIALSQKNEKQAIIFLEKILLNHKTFEDAAVSLGALYERKGKIEKALKLYKEFLNSDPDNYSILSALVRIYSALEKDNEVLPYLEKLSSLDPSNLNLKVKLGVLYNNQKRFEDAKGIFKEILEVVPDSEKIQYYLATIYLQNKEANLALEHFSKIPENGSLFKEAQIQTANILSSQILNEKNEINNESYKKFKSFIENKTSKHPDLELDLKVILASFYETSSKYQDAIDTMKSIEKIKGFGEEHDYYLASLLDKNKNVEEAKLILERILLKNPNNASALNFLGYTYIEQGIKYEEAFALIQKAIKIRPEDGYIRDTLGWYYYKTGDYKKALKEIKKAWEKEKTDVTISTHLAIVYQKLKQYSMAEKYFAEALKNCKQEAEKLQVIEAIADFQKEKSTQRLPASE